MTFPIENGAALFTTEAVAAGDVVSAALRLDNSGNNLGVRVVTSGGTLNANGFMFDVDGRLLVVDSTTGIPAGSVSSNGLLFSAGALCISSNAVATYQNGLPLDVNGALVVNVALLAMLVLRKYGTDAHLWMPGLGYVNGIQAGNYLDASLTPTSVGNPVGYVLDAGGGSITASNSTTAQKPILNQTGSKYRWTFDGSDDRLALSSLPFVATDDYAVLWAANTTNAGVSDVFAIGSSTLSEPFILIDMDGSGFARYACRDNALGSLFLSDTTTVIRGANAVVGGRKISNTRSLWRGGVKRQEGTLVLGATTVDTAMIGARPIPGGVSVAVTGQVFGVVAIKGTVTDADMLTLSNFLGAGL